MPLRALWGLRQALDAEARAQRKKGPGRKPTEWKKHLDVDLKRSGSRRIALSRALRAPTCASWAADEVKARPEVSRGLNGTSAARGSTTRCTAVTSILASMSKAAATEGANLHTLTPSER